MSALKTSLSFIALLSVIFIGRPVFAASYTFTGDAPAPGNHDWSDARNWSPAGGPPGAGDSVEIGGADSGFVVSLDDDVMIDSLDIINSEIDGDGSLEVEQTSTITFTLFALSGGLTLNGTTDIYPMNDVDTETETDDAFVNVSTLEMHEDATFIIGDDATVENNAHWQLDSNAKLSISLGATFVNSEALYCIDATIDAGDGIVTNGPDGFIISETNSINDFEGVLESAGTIYTLTNAEFNIDSSSRVHFSGGASISGRGILSIDCPVTMDGSVTLDGQLTYMTDGANTPEGITIDGTFEISSGGVFYWYGGSFNGVGTNLTGTVSVDSGGILVIYNDVNGLGINNAILTNNGIVYWTNSGSIQLANSAQIINSGIFNLDGDSLLRVANSDTSPVSFQNAGGTVDKRFGGTNNTATKFQNVPFYDNGTLMATLGNVELAGGGSINTWVTDDDGVIKMLSGAFTANAGAQMYGPGYVELYAPATLDVPENAMFTILGAFIQASGTIFGSGAVAVYQPGIFQWNGGTISITNSDGAVVVNSGALMSIEGASNAKNLLYGTLLNQGSIEWTNDNSIGGINLGNDAAIDNSGQFTIGCDAYMTDISTTNAPIFFNEEGGSLAKFANLGTTTIGVKFVDVGLLVAQSGTLEFVNFNDAYLDGFPLPQIVLNGGKIQIDNALTLHANISGSGQIIAKKPLTLSDGDLIVTVIILTGEITDDELFDLGSFFGILTIQGDFFQTANGTLVVPIQGTNSPGGFGKLTATGNVNLGGTLKVALTNGYAAPIGLSYAILAGLQRNGTFTNLVLPQGLGVTYNGGGASIVVTNAVPSIIAAPQVSGGDFQFGFNVAPGQSYTVQYKDDLNAPAWNVLTNFVASSTNISFSVPVTSSPNLFVRVLQP